MNFFLSYFPKGSDSIIEQLLIKSLKKPNIVYNKDGVIIYKTNSHWKSIQNLSFFMSSFLLIKYFTRKVKLNDLFNWAFNNELFPKKISEFKTGSFRIVESRTDLDKTKFKKQRLQLENDLENYLHINIDKGDPDFEIRLVEDDDISFIGIRLTKPKQTKLRKHKGSLNKSLASILVEHSEPEENDIFLDPFCGGGIIPLIRSTHSSYKRIIASDKSIEEITQRLNNMQDPPDNFKIIKSRVQSLPQKLDFKVNKIVTDPPWGLIENNLDIDKFYTESLSSLTSILVNNGIMILLTRRKSLVRDYCSSIPELDIKFINNIEVSGQNSYIIKIKKE